MSKEIRVGDEVRVLNKGATYGTYYTLLNEFFKDEENVSRYYGKSFTMDKNPNNGEVGVVMDIRDNRSFGNATIALIDIDNQLYMIGVTGLENINPRVEITIDVTESEAEAINKLLKEMRK